MTVRLWSHKIRLFTLLFVFVLSAVAHAAGLPHESSSEEKQWQSILHSHREKTSLAKAIENGGSGLAIFAVGTYGASADTKGAITSSIYALMQTGGVLLASRAIRDFLEPDFLLSAERVYLRKKFLTRQEFRELWRSVELEKERSQGIADVFLWTSLSGVYLSSALRESKSSDTLRSIYFFLSANSLILASVASYKLFSIQSSEGFSSRFSIMQKFQVMNTKTNGLAMEMQMSF